MTSVLSLYSSQLCLILGWGGRGGVDRIKSYQLRAHGSRSHRRAPRGWQLKGLDHQTNTVKVAIILMGDWDKKRLRNTYLHAAHRQ